MPIINGTPGDDQEGFLLSGTATDDEYFGFAGDDWLIASSGNDVLDGGADNDTVFYDFQFFPNGVFINNTDTAIGSVLAFTVNKGPSGTDTLVDVENFHGRDNDDTIYVGGLGGTSTFDRAGDDTVIASQNPNATGSHFFAAGSGNDTYVGTVNQDIVDYFSDGFDGSGATTQGAQVDLAAGTAIDGWGDTDSLTSIEDVSGTRFGDIILGDDGNNNLSGNDGDDTIDGRGGDDFLQGGAGNDTIDGSDGNDYLEGDDFEVTGNDILRGGAGDDSFAPGYGDDTVDGGDGLDVVFYDFWGFTSGVTINNTDTEQDGVAAFTTDKRGFGTDTLVDVEAFHGSEWDDIIYVGAGGSYSFDRAGDDLVVASQDADAEGHFFGAGSGNDTYIGSVGFDAIDYEDDGGDSAGAIFQGVSVDLAAGTAIDGWGDTDSLTSVEEVNGTRFGDTIFGDDEDNRLRGMDGDDTLEGRGGNDNIDGNDGNDDITGGDGNDDLSGGDGDDIIDGGAGDDFLQPGTGNDTVSGGDIGPSDDFDELSYIFTSIESGTTGGIIATFTGEQEGTVIDYEGGTDTFSDIERVRGTNNDDTFIGAEGRQRFRGFGGDDDFDGGAGDNDEVDYRRDAAELGSLEIGIDVSLAAGFGTDTYGDTDTYSNIERIRGSRFDDTIVGDGNRNRLSGFDGGDTIDVSAA
ncbi:hypothetical protein RA27_19335 [Ruegeria sp. ANG-R]|uniref:calcium-binding protein n=1 Tax=Ruegeria sp. ANG-R TaxID=1577903 RepID=UPI00057E7D0A|nr:calcium-binding protein [Ruegeria sp. ANG-R]KIC38584.1 hypothetical protein RA27_19335 [Ruegeria sp. ANG-R]